MSTITKHNKILYFILYILCNSSGVVYAKSLPRSTQVRSQDNLQISAHTSNIKQANKHFSQNSNVSNQSSIEQEARRLLEDIDRNAIEISLNDAITRAINTNPALVSAYRQIEAAEWSKIGIQRGWVPTINLYGSPAIGPYYQTTKIHSRTGQILPGDITTSSANFSNTLYVSPAIEIQWTFFDPSRGPSIASSGRTVEQQRFLFDSAARSLILNVSQAYFNLQGTKALVDQYRLLSDISRQAYLAISAQQKAGLMDVGNSAQIATQYTTNINNYYTATAQLVSQGAVLASLLNYPDGTFFVASDPMKPNLDWNLSLSESISRGKAFNEQILAAYANANALKWQVRSLINSYYPKLFAYGAGFVYNYQGVQNANLGERATYSSSNVQNNQSVGQFGLGFTWNFDGGVNAANSLSVKRRQQAAEADYQSTILSVTANIKAAYGTYRSLSLALESVNKGVEAAKLNQEVTQAKYELGLSDVTSLVQSIQLYSSAVQQQVQSMISLNTATAELYRYTAIWPVNAVNAFKNRRSTLPSK